MSGGTKRLLEESWKAVLSAVAISLWVYFLADRFTASWLHLTAVDVLVPLAIVAICALVDIALTIQIRFSLAIMFAYPVSIFAWVGLLLIASPSIVSSGLMGIYAVLIFVAVRFAAQLFVTPSLHWIRHERSQTDHAVTSVLILAAKDDGPRFLLVKNDNINVPAGLWVSPGGRWTPSQEPPERRLAEKIETEVNLKCRFLSFSPFENLLDDADPNSSEVQWFASPHFLLYERLASIRPDFAHYHLDFVYLCESDGAPAGLRPKYGPSSRLLIPVEKCVSSFDAAFAAVADAVDEWYMKNSGVRPSKHTDISDDVVRRMHLTARAYSASKKNAQPS